MNNLQTTTPTPETQIDWDHICTNCGYGFNTSMAHQIVLNDTEVELMCSWCTHTDTYESSDVEEIERPPAIHDHTVETDKHGRTTAWIDFDGGATVQYRETSVGRVREEVFTADELIKSSNTEIEYDGADLDELYDSPEEYLSRTLNEYKKFTVRGLGIHRPHIATAVRES